MDSPRVISAGDVVQIAPGTNGRFGGCLLTVGRVTDSGVDGFIDLPSVGRYRISCSKGEFAYVGRAIWDVYRVTGP